MDKGVEIGAILLIVSLIVIGGGYYYMTRKLPKE